MQNSILIFFIILTQSSSLLFPNFFSNNLPKIIENVPENHEMCVKVSETYQNLVSSGIQHFKTEYSPEIVKFSSGLLPAMDSIAHHVLTANQNFIGFVLSSNFPDDLKKDLVLFSISSTQHGDMMGSHILSFYYHLVEKLL